MNYSMNSLLIRPLSVLVQTGVAFAFTVSLAQAASSAVTTCSVNTTADDPATASATVTASTNAGTLRDCILAANVQTGSTGHTTLPGMTISFIPAMSGATISLNSDLPLLFNNTVIDASALANPVAIDGGNTYRIFFVSGLPPIPVSGAPDPDGSQAITVTLRNLKLQHGRAKGGDAPGGGGGMGAGGALFVNKAASVSLSGVSFDGNGAQGGASNGSSYGGGGGMGSGVSFNGGGGLGKASAGGSGAGLGTGGIAATTTSGGWGGQGLGQLSSVQGFNATYFDVDNGSGASGLGLIGGGGMCCSTVGGGFGGGGAFTGNQSIGGAGGFGGGGGRGDGGGGSSGGGNGGFGGGGGGGQSAPGGSGGFGGGGGSIGAAGSGFGGIGGGIKGGGAGFGGAVFVRAGGSLIVQNPGVTGGIAAGSVTAGVGGGGRADNGAAAGSGLFLMGGATTTFDIAGSYRISDTLADDSTSTLPTSQFSYTPGSGPGAAITKQGAGILVLSGANTYAGATSVNAGVLRVASPGSIAKSTTTVAAAGTLGGDGITGPVASFGTLAPGTPTNPQGTLAVQGALQIQLGALTCFHADGVNAVSDINVTGNATLNGVARIDFSGSPSVGTIYYPLSAANVSGTFSGYETNMPNLLGSFGYSANQVTFTVTVSDVLFRHGFEPAASNSPCIAAFAN